MNRLIKFRGKSIFTNKFVYGDYTTYFTGKPQIKSFINGKWISTEIYPQSLCQFCGYDRLHKEVYENDLVWTPDGKSICKISYYDNPYWIAICTLVE